MDTNRAAKDARYLAICTARASVLAQGALVCQLVDCLHLAAAIQCGKVLSSILALLPSIQHVPSSPRHMHNLESRTRLEATVGRTRWSTAC